tara:strand:+ start:399 stop:1235 length:837 start_codon:yes stop_codon:yes gene_type:complete
MLNKRSFIQFYKKTPIGFFGSIFVVLLIIVAIFAPYFSLYDPIIQDYQRFMPPNIYHWLGTDSLGRDIYSRIIHGTRVSMFVGLLAVTIALLSGTTIGIISGYYGGRIDTILMRFIDILLSFPGLVLAMLISGLLGPSLVNAMIAVGIMLTPSFARVSRGSVLSIKYEPYIASARIIGCSDLYIIFHYILPNIMVPLSVLFSISLSIAILAESALSFLGLGIQPPSPSWGGMLHQGRPFMEIAPWVAVFPGLAIMIAVLSFNLLGDGLRDALDPKLKN